MIVFFELISLSLLDFLDLKKSSWEYTDLFQRLIGIFIKYFLREGLHYLKLIVRIVKAEILVGQRPHKVVEHLHFVGL